MYCNITGDIGGGGEIGKFLSPCESAEVKPPDVHFKDVAGQENTKREVANL